MPSTSLLPHAGMCKISDTAREHRKPALLQVSNQIRAETIPIHYSGATFEVLVTVDTLHVIEHWAASLTATELKSIRRAFFRFQLSASHCLHGSIDDGWVH